MKHPLDEHHKVFCRGIFDSIRDILERKALIEMLANVEHDRWSGWEKHRTRDGVTQEDEQRWVRQRDTPYAELSEREKELDRKEVYKTLDVIIDYLKEVILQIDSSGRDCK